MDSDLTMCAEKIVDLSSLDNLDLTDNSRCPVGLLDYETGKCLYSGDICYFVNNGRKGMGVKRCQVIPTIYYFINKK